MRWIAACVALILASWPASTLPAAPVESGRVASVTDGDTFRLESGERIRIAGIDAPETQPGNAKCAIELVRGKAATKRAIALLDHRMVAFQRVGRSYRRIVARVRLDDRDLGGLLVSEGIARWWPRGDPKPDWCGGQGLAMPSLRRPAPDLRPRPIFTASARRVAA